MRKLLITLDDELDNLLAGAPNQSEIVRNALRLYMHDISTPDTIAGLRESYSKLQSYMQSKSENYDRSFAKLDKLIEYLETRV